ncbi:MAG: cupin domain-containing protein [Deltaproteobacteria bacterium]|nr:cupin domain-containing protein [Deltaproteobacteria bacterium]
MNESSSTQTSSRVSPATDPHAPLWHLGSLFRWLATAHETGGAFALAEVVVRAGAEPPPHVHANEEESFYVLEGDLEFLVDGVSTRARAGDFLVLPRGKVHAFLVRSAEARLLLMVTPGGLDEAFVATSEPAPRAALPPPMDGPPPREVIERLLAIHGARGVRFQLGGPPEGAPRTG